MLSLLRSAIKIGGALGVALGYGTDHDWEVGGSAVLALYGLWLSHQAHAG